MNIGLIDVDCHASSRKRGSTVYPNLALCRIAAYHKSRGDHVEWADMFSHYDILYKSRIFNFSEDDHYAYSADKVIKGGTGYDIRSRLPEEIDRMPPDYSIYPAVPPDTAYGFLTRGCPNKCPWCVVPRKEGTIRPYRDISDIATPQRRKVILMDNNILAAGDYAAGQLDKIIKAGLQVDFNQGLDARLVDGRFASLLARVRWIHGRIRFGCDTHAQIRQCQRAMDLLMSHGFRGEFFLYTMLSADFDESFSRVNHWREQLLRFRQSHQGCAVYAYAQPWRDPDARNDPPQWQRDMATWCNKRMLFSRVSFEDFEPRNGFRCKEYFNKQK